MQVSDYSLRQLDEAYLRSLKPEALQDLSVRLLSDLKEARDRLGSGPGNSSRPPSSRPAWEKGLGTPTALASGIREALESDAAAVPAVESVPVEPASVEPTPSQSTESAPASNAVGRSGDPVSVRKSGKQRGAAGVGRTQVLRADEVQVHRPLACAGCGASLGSEVAGTAYSGFQSVDVVLRSEESRSPGLVVRLIDHRLYAVGCGCGHVTRAELPSRPAEPGESATVLSEWRLVGPGLAALIVALSMRFRLSRRRIAEFLAEWLGLRLSVGVIQETLAESAAAVAPAEEELATAVVASALLHADETPWPEQGRILWLWVFVTVNTTLYYVSHRGRELLDTLLPDYTGWLMSDGWCAYRSWRHRLRCWPHLTRKAQGLIESRDRTAQGFGRQVLGVFQHLQTAIYAARAGPDPDASIAAAHTDALRGLREACECHQSGNHPKTRALAVELLNDWDAIFQVLQHPQLPISNNAAERALRHWVILRQLSHGTRTPDGSRYFAILASVIDTCRQRRHSPWRYLQDAITQRRQGLPLPALPA
jgi:transposase